MPISNEQLRETLLTPAMRCYFGKKLPEIPPATLDIRIDEALKFLNMSAFCGGSIPVTQEIDDIWHLWILESKQYMRLCSLLPGGEYIHHQSNTFTACDSGDATPPNNSLEHDVAVLGNYVLNYGPFEADRAGYWLLARRLLDTGTFTIDTLNDWLRAGLTLAGSGAEA